jgi:tRNA G18 (ribose-2'-O)-methylase SpoU
VTSLSAFPQTFPLAIGVYHGKHEQNVGTLWRSAYIYGASMLFTVAGRYYRQPTDTIGAANHLPLLQFADFDSFRRSYDGPIVAVEMTDGACPLDKWNPPSACAVMLGAEDHGIPRAVLEQCQERVTIVTPRQLCLNVAVAGSLVLDHWSRRIGAHRRPHMRGVA